VGGCDILKQIFSCSVLGGGASKQEEMQLVKEFENYEYNKSHN
jgi:hypothetical protein